MKIFACFEALRSTKYYYIPILPYRKSDKVVMILETNIGISEYALFAFRDSIVQWQTIP